jgi:hypothetical protein
MKCANCDGDQWVCEAHPDVPWRGGEGCCGGAGMPCTCNKLHRDNWTTDQKIHHAYCDYANEFGKPHAEAFRNGIWWARNNLK